MFKKLFLRRNIIFKCAVIIQVVTRDICEHRRVKVYALESPLRERLRRSLHDAGFAPLRNGAREQRIKLRRLRRSQPARQIFIPEAVADRPGEQCFRPRIGKDIPDKRGHRRFAVCAGDAYQSELALRVITECRAKARICVSEDKSVFMAEAPKGTLINGVGAGDSMVAGFLAGWMKSHDYKEAFRMGVACGSVEHVLHHSGSPRQN